MHEGKKFSSTETSAINIKSTASNECHETMTQYSNVCHKTKTLRAAAEQCLSKNYLKCK